jgi:hypothetical protein
MSHHAERAAEFEEKAAEAKRRSHTLQELIATRSLMVKQEDAS